MDFQDIIGQEKTLRKLQNLLEKGTLPHTLLFAGAGGVGKRTVAEIVAGYLLCEKQTFCRSCPSCSRYEKQTHPDFHRYYPMTKNEWEGKEEKDGKTKKERFISIAQMRAMIADVARSTQLAKNHVVIIEDADKMRVEAQNAILKTIEEPTVPTYFILLTAKSDNLLITIKSRASLFSFGLLQDSELSEYVGRTGLDRSLLPLANGSIGTLYRLNTLEAQDNLALARELLTKAPKYRELELIDKAEELAKLSKDSWAEILNFMLLEIRNSLVEGAKLRLNSPMSVLRLVLGLAYRLQYNVNLRLQIEAFLLELVRLEG